MSLIEATCTAYKNKGIACELEEYEGFEAIKMLISDEDESEYGLLVIDCGDLISVDVQKRVSPIPQVYKYCNTINSLSDMKYWYAENNGLLILENKIKADSTVEDLMACITVTIEEAFRFARSYQKAV